MVPGFPSCHDDDLQVLQENSRIIYVEQMAIAFVLVRLAERPTYANMDSILDPHWSLA